PYYRPRLWTPREGGIEQPGEVALLECRDWQLDEGGGTEVPDAILLKVREPETLVSAVIDLRDVHGAADTVAPIKKLERRTALARCIVRKAVGVQCVVLEISKSGAVNLVSPGLDRKVGDARLPPVVLRTHRACLEFELAHGFSAWTEFIV